LVVFADSVVFVATLWEKLPNLKLAIPLSEVKYSPPHRDVGILELPVLF
jgi:nitric oxide reductase